jgi:UDP-2,4-diacetamido-2,4,6-trideoxy-beta-L-altropyranose hydrolase
MGIGHMMRCLTLADALRARGVGILFVCRDHPGNLANLLRSRSIEVALLPRSTDSPSDAEYGDWLGASPPEDAEQTIRALRGAHVQWLIVDHYALDFEWERRLSAHSSGILAIDDLANRRHACSLLIDQNFTASAEDRYGALTPAACRLMLGPLFAMLRPEYRRARSSARLRNGEVRRIFVFLGGSDPGDLTGMALDVLRRPEFRDLGVDVVAGVNYARRDSLEKAVSSRPNSRLYGPQFHLADLMAEADLSIGAGGATTWERMCLGLPSIVISIAENQRPACVSLAKAGLINYVGHHSAVNADDLAGAIQRDLARPAELAEASLRSQLLVDGWGAERIVESMIPTAKESLRLRRAAPDDVHQYFAWANDPEVRAQSVQTQPIAFENHKKWFADKLTSPDSRLFVMQAGDLPVGQIRFDRDGGGETIDYSVDRLFRGRGWGSRLASMGMAQFSPRNGTVFYAKVKESNLPSRAVFSRLGFAELAAEPAGGMRTFGLDPSRQVLNGDSKCE